MKKVYSIVESNIGVLNALVSQLKEAGIQFSVQPGQLTVYASKQTLIKALKGNIPLQEISIREIDQTIQAKLELGKDYKRFLYSEICSEATSKALENSNGLPYEQKRAKVNKAYKALLDKRFWPVIDSWFDKDCPYK